MSSDPVRAAFRDAWGTYAGAIPRVEVINLEPDIPAEADAPLFGTLLFDVTSRRDLTMGSRPWVEEQGTVTVGLYGPAGAGDAAVTAAATSILVALAAASLGGGVEVGDVTGPIDAEPAGDGQFYGVQIAAAYTWHGRETREGG